MFQLVGAPSYPLTLAPGSAATFGLRFVPTSPGIKSATLAVASNDRGDAEPGRASPGSGSGSATSEPSLQQILDTYQVPDSTGDPSPGDVYLPTTAPLGDELNVRRSPRPVPVR